MPRIDFNLRDDRDLPDTIDRDLPNFAVARRVAIERVDSILTRSSDHVAFSTDRGLDVTDERGLVLARLHLETGAIPPLDEMWAGWGPEEAAKSP